MDKNSPFIRNPIFHRPVLLGLLFFKWTVLYYFIVVCLGEDLLESLFRRMKIRNEGKIAACSFYRQSSNQSQVFIFALGCFAVPKY